MHHSYTTEWSQWLLIILAELMSDNVMFSVYILKTKVHADEYATTISNRYNGLL